MLRIIKADGAAEKAFMAEMKRRSGEEGAAIERDTAKIMADVRVRGYEAVIEHSLNFDHAEPYEVSCERIKQAYDSIGAGLRDALETAAENIRKYNEKIMLSTSEWRDEHGAIVGQIVRGLSRVGVYVPGGTAAYPSSVLMTAVPARVAGVGEIIVVTPPTENLSDAVLAAAYIAGVDRVLAVGGVQAIAALTYGAGFIPRVDKIAGPGNAYVTAAKRMAYGDVDIDIIAGPSEILVIADGMANPEYVAADLCGQAEHGELSSAILATDSLRFAESVAEEIDKQVRNLPRGRIIEQALNDYGAAVVFDNLEKACDFANEIAPEHLEIQTDNPRKELKLIKNAGAVFLGEYSTEAMGDYIAGPSHVLPTSGTARFFSPLSCESFLKKMSVIEYTSDAAQKLGVKAALIADAERLGAHANSIRVRFT